MKKILLSILFLFPALVFAQSQFSGIVLYVTDSATYRASSTITNAHSQGKADICWNAQATTPHYDIWTGAAYEHVFTFAGSGGTGVTDGDKGDITVSSSGTVWTIDNAAVTFAKIQNADALSVVGRSANSSGVVDEIAAGTDHQVLRRSGTSIGFGAINLAQSAAVTGTLPATNLPDADDDGTTKGVATFTNADFDATAGVVSLTHASSSSSLTDGAAITITGLKHTLTSDEATVTWTLSQTSDYQTTDIILNATSSTWTFPANTLCVVEGAASGDNVAELTGTSGDHYIMSIYKDGSNYRVVIKNFGQ